MRKTFRTISTIIFTLLAIDSIAKAEVKVVTSIKPIHSLVSYVMDGVGKPDIIVDGYNSPHNFSLKPSHAKMIEKANLIIWVGEDLETFLEKPLKSIIKEILTLKNEGYSEITLLGQNVDSYLWYGGGLKKDFKHATELQKKSSLSFSKLLDLIATNFKSIRIRFTTSNPQDMSEDVLNVMAKHKNICKHIHLPVQSGSDKILSLMNRKHTINEYKELINKIRRIIPNCGISHDIITGFPNESEDDHKLTLELMNYVKYDFGFMFKYSERPGTPAYKKLDDNVPEKIKQKRLHEIIDLQQKHSFNNLKDYVGTNCEVLIEKESKKSSQFWCGRNSQNIMVVFPKKNHKPGDMVSVKIIDNTTTTLIGRS